MKKNLTSSPIAPEQEMPPHNGAETAGNTVSRAAEGDQAPDPGNETDTTRNATKARKTRKAEAGAANGTRPDTAVSSKAVYLAVVQAYIRDAVNNLRTADEDHDPKAAREIYGTEIAIGNLLQSHLDLTPAEMTDVLPDQTGIPMEDRIPGFNATRTLFFMDHLHRVLFRPEEPDPHDTAEGSHDRKLEPPPIRSGFFVY